jgi:hypothetical protein
VKAASKEKLGQGNATKVILKRKVSYANEDVSITCSKVAKLQIGEAPKADKMEGVMPRSD